MSKATAGGAIYTVLAATGSVTALREGRMWPGQAPSNLVDTDYPYQVYKRFTGIPFHHMKGNSGKSNSTVQVSSFALFEVAADDLADKSRVALEAASGTYTIEGDDITVKKFRMDDDAQRNQRSGDSSGDIVFQVDQNYTVEHTIGI